MAIGCSLRAGRLSQLSGRKYSSKMILVKEQLFRIEFCNKANVFDTALSDITRKPHCQHGQNTPYIQNSRHAHYKFQSDSDYICRIVYAQINIFSCCFTAGTKTQLHVQNHATDRTNWYKRVVEEKCGGAWGIDKETALLRYMLLSALCNHGRGSTR
jgi:hypothetical protein